MTNYRSYLLSSAVFFILWGLSMLYSVFVDPSLVWYDFPAYEVVEAILPYSWWGVISSGLGFAFLYEFLVAKREKKTWITLWLSSAATFITLIWALGLMITMLDDLNSPLGFLLFGACAAAHVRGALYNPTEVDPISVHEALETIKRLSGDDFS
jgi:hypothetical protein